MAKIYFADGTTMECESTFQSDVLNAVKEDNIEDITDKIDCYDLEDDEAELVKNHPDADFYQAYDDVCGAWQQPLYIFAVED